jgi:hypothetical protein
MLPIRQDLVIVALDDHRATAGGLGGVEGWLCGGVAGGTGGKWGVLVMGGTFRSLGDKRVE